MTIHKVLVLSSICLLGLAYMGCGSDTDDKVCVDGETKCDGNKVMKCTADGVFGAAEDCPEGQMCMTMDNGLQHCMKMEGSDEGMTDMTGGDEGMTDMTGGDEGMTDMTGGDEGMTDMTGGDTATDEGGSDDDEGGEAVGPGGPDEPTDGGDTTGG